MTLSEPGKFITLEGVEGAGKGSSLEHVQQLIEAAGKPVICTREPGGTDLGEAIRELLLGHKHTGMCHDAELLMMFAARAEHLEAKIRPALSTGIWVLCDRFTDATYAYQGGGRGIEVTRIRVLEEWVQDDLRPDLTLLLDLPVAVGLERAGRRSAPDRFETEAERFFEAVRSRYLAIAEAEPQRVQVIDASPGLAEVQAQITRVVNAYIKHS